LSSHHFVKEGQEPALFILDALSLELAEPLLEWAPLVIVTDTVLPTVLRWGIKIDVVLVQVDRMAEMNIQLNDQGPVQIISYNDQNDLLSAVFTFLINKEQKAVNVMGETSDFLFTTINRFTQKIQVDVFAKGINWLCIYAGRYEKWLPAKSRLMIRVEENQNIQSKGISHQQQFWEAEKDGMVTIQSDRSFWVGEFSD
jgi:hypothetical protein